MAAVPIALCAMLLEARQPPTCLSSQLPSDGTRAVKPPIKGVELYSWRAQNGRMRFSLLWGTNRLKTEGEIKAPTCALSPPEVKAALSRLAEGEHVFWMWDPRECPSCSQPSSEVVAELTAHATRVGITIETSPDLAGR